MRVTCAAAAITAALITVCSALKCHQCNGWHGMYPLRGIQMSTCDNRNNQCESQQFCVKIVDTMSPGVEYATYKSDCYYHISLQVNPQNLSVVANKQCLPYQDGSTPVRRWMYCFCNDRDYCNASTSVRSILLLVLIIGFY